MPTPRFLYINKMQTASITPGNDATRNFTEISYPPINMFDRKRDIGTRTIYRSFEIVFQQNDMLDYYDGATGTAGTKSITIPPGIYYATELASTIETLLNAQNPAGTGAYAANYTTFPNFFTISRASGTLNLLWLRNNADTGAATNRIRSIGSTLGYDVARNNTGGLSYTGQFASLGTGGRFEITALNNKLRVGAAAPGGTDVTVPPGTYSAKSLCTQLAHALNTAFGTTMALNNGFDVYRRDAALTFQMKRNPSVPPLAAMWFQFGHVNSTLTPVLGFHPTDDNPGDGNYTVAEFPRIHTSEEWVFDAGVDRTFGLITVINLFGNFSPTSTVRIQFDSNANWVAPEFNQTFVYNPVHLLKGYPSSVFTADNFGGQAPPDTRYARIEVIDIDNMDGFVEIGEFFAGEYVAQSSNRWFGKVIGRRPLRSRSVSGGGHVYGLEIFNPLGFDLPMNARTDGDLQQIDAVVVQCLDFKSFLLMEDLEGTAAEPGNQHTLSRWVMFYNIPDFTETQVIKMPWDGVLSFIEGR